MDISDITDALTALGPAEVEGKAGRVKARTVDEAIQALQSNEEAIEKKHRGLRFTRLSPPGTG